MVRKGGMALLTRDGVVPDVPPHDEWGKAPYIGKEGDNFWKKAGSFKEGGYVDGTPLVMFNGRLDKSQPLPPHFPRLEIERGDYPYCPVDFHAASGPFCDWESWTDSIVGNPSYKIMLQRAGILDTVRLCGSLVCRRDRHGLNGLISRWNSSTNTFVATWGEFSPTLEDVYVLLGLPIFGWVTSDEEFSREERNAVESLKGGFSLCQHHKDPFTQKAPGKASFLAWLKYYYRSVEPKRAAKKSGKADGETSEATVGSEERGIISGPGASSDHVLAAFIAAWLSRFIFPSPPEDGINASVFPYAAQLAKGTQLPLGPLFLGTFYTRLGQIRDGLIRSVGRYDICSFLSTTFLTLFMFERFPTHAPGTRDLPSGGITLRARSWLDKSGTWNYFSFVDSEKDFAFRPYVTSVPGEKKLTLYPLSLIKGSSGSLTRPSGVIEHLPPPTIVDLFSAFLSPSSLPVCIKEGRTSVSYNPHRVLRQFGFDQGVPRFVSAAAGCYTQSLGRFSWLQTGRLSEGEIMIPPKSRRGGVTREWQQYWRMCLSSFRNFIDSHPQRAVASDVPKLDPLLRIPKKNVARAIEVNSGEELPRGKTKKRPHRVTESRNKEASTVKDKRRRKKNESPPVPAISEHSPRTSPIVQLDGGLRAPRPLLMILW